MTGNVLLDLAISFVGIAILVGLARLIFKNGDAGFTAETARRRLELDEPDFAPVRWAVDEAAGAAIVANDSGEIALIVAWGDGLVVRRLMAISASAVYKDTQLIIARTDLTSKPVSIAMDNDEAKTWLDCLKD